MEGNKVSGIR